MPAIQAPSTHMPSSYQLLAPRRYAVSATANRPKPATSSHQAGSAGQPTIDSVPTTTTMRTRSPSGYERLVITSAGEPLIPVITRDTVKADTSAPTASEATSASSTTLSDTRFSWDRASRIRPTEASG